MKIWLQFIIYFIVLSIAGYLTSNIGYYYRPLAEWNAIIWFTIFMAITFGFKPTRKFLIPLLRFDSFKEPQTYVYIFVTVLAPYVMLKIAVYFEVFLPSRQILRYKLGLFREADLLDVISACLTTPIWEEMVIRGLLLFGLLKVMKSYWAIPIVTIVFTLIHPPSNWVLILSGAFLLTFTAYKTKSLIPSMVAHSLWNLYMLKLITYF